MAADWCGRPLPDDRDGWKARALAFRESLLEAEAENERLRAFAEDVRDNWGALTGYELERDARRALGE